MNNGAGGFSVNQTIASNSGHALQIADFNDDGYEDIVTVGGGNTNGDIHLGQAGGTFAAASAFALGSVSYSNAASFKTLLAGDFDGDGKADIVISRENGANPNDLFLMAGNGSGNFGAAVLISANNPGAGLSAADFEGDGDLDILAGQAQTYFLNYGSGLFSEEDTGGTLPQGSRATAITDLNQDGVPDLILGYWGSGGGAGTSVFLQDSEVSGKDFSFFPAMDLLTADGRAQALVDIAAVRGALHLTLANIGAYQSRIEISIMNNLVKSENYKAASGRIMEAEVAQESARLSRLQILQQIGAAVLAQANQQPAIALTLLNS